MSQLNLKVTICYDTVSSISVYSRPGEAIKEADIYSILSEGLKDRRIWSLTVEAQK